MPDDVAEEKSKALEALGARVEKVRPASIVDMKQVNNNVASHIPRDLLTLPFFVCFQVCGQQILIQMRYFNFVTKKCSQNLAKQRALEFGKTGIRQSTDVAVSTTVHKESNGSRSSPLSNGGPRGFFADQFENRSNFDAHYEGTGPEIWRQTNGNVDAFVSGAGVSFYKRCRRRGVC